MDAKIVADVLREIEAEIVYQRSRGYEAKAIRACPELAEALWFGFWYGNQLNGTFRGARVEADTKTDSWEVVYDIPVTNRPIDNAPIDNRVTDAARLDLPSRKARLKWLKWLMGRT